MRVVQPSLSFLTPLPVLRPCYHRMRCISRRPRFTPTASLKQWVETNAAKFNHIDFERSRTTKSVLSGTELFSVQEGAWLTLKQASQLMTKENKAFASLDIHPEANLALYILLERAKLADSSWHSLLQSFPHPSHLHVPYLWHDDELQWIRGTRAHDTALEERDSIIEEWNRVYDHALTIFSEQFCQEWLSCPLYIWAVAVVDTQMIQDTLGVFHNFPRAYQGNCVIRKGGGIFAKPRLELFSTEDIENSQPIVIGDGLKYRDERFEQGDIGGEDRAWLKVDLVAIDPLYEDKLLVVERYMKEESFVWLSISDETEKFEPSPELARYLRLVCLTGPDSFLLEAVFSSDIWDILDLPVSPENEQAICDLVIGACDDLIEEYYDGDGKGPRWRLATELISGERRVVEKLKAWFQARLEILDSLEYYAERRLKSLDLLRPVDESEIVQSDSGWRAGTAFDDYYV